MTGDCWWFLALRCFGHRISVVPSDDDDPSTIVGRLWRLEVRDAASISDFWLNSLLARHSLYTSIIWVAMWDLTKS